MQGAHCPRSSRDTLLAQAPSEKTHPHQVKQVGLLFAEDAAGGHGSCREVYRGQVAARGHDSRRGLKRARGRMPQRVGAHLVAPNTMDLLWVWIYGRSGHSRLSVTPV
jgi:hypothetical protein